MANEATQPGGRMEGKVALITGAGGGIGRAIAERFAAAGVRVLVHDLVASGREVAQTLPGADFLQADLSDPDQVRQLARQALEIVPRVDILINNAGFQHIAPIDECPEPVWNRMVQVMLTAPFQLIRLVAPSMKEAGWGRIINIASIHGLVASPLKAPYVSAKHGLVGLTRAAALELGSFGITVNALCPAYVRTPLVERQIAEQARHLGIPEDQVVSRVMLEPAAIRRLIEPEEVASLAFYLASEQGRSITGAALTLDLGWTCR